MIIIRSSVVVPTAHAFVGELAAIPTIDPFTLNDAAAGAAGNPVALASEERPDTAATARAVTATATISRENPEKRTTR
jgi:hypothetical protein